MPRRTPDASLVRALLADQHPHWAHLPITPVLPGGWDNRTFRLGDDLSIRMPSAAHYASQVTREHRWLPRLAPHLPLPITTPVALGAPGHGYPHPWSINQWLPGQTATHGTVGLARDLAGFLNALFVAPVPAGPRPGPDNFFRGGRLSVYDAETRQCIDALQAHIDPQAAADLWDDALTTDGEGEVGWIHGDVSPGNLLVQGGQLSAVIDFGQLAVGDRACDMAFAWTFLSPDAREAFRAATGVGAGVWARGKGWALWKALLQCRAHGMDHAEHVTLGRLGVV